MILENDLLLRAARGEKTERTPVWLMRQAGRILPQYRALRGKLSGFKELVETPELAAEVTIQPVDELGVDAAIIFSDILVIPEAMGLPYQMVEKKGPWFENTIKGKADVERMIAAEASGVSYTLKAIEETKKNLNGRVPLIGFAGAPWTIFCYMLEGEGSKTFSKARKFLFEEPELSHQLFEKITTSTINYLKGQIAAGVNLVQIFDSWAGILQPEHYKEFGLRYIQQICDAIDEVPKTVFAKGAWFVQDRICNLNCDVVGLDWHSDPYEFRTQNPSKVLQGNLDPAVLYAPAEEVEKQTLAMLNWFGDEKHIANLGHGVYPDTPLENVRVFVNTVKNHHHK